MRQRRGKSSDHRAMAFLIGLIALFLLAACNTMAETLSSPATPQVTEVPFVPLVLNDHCLVAGTALAYFDENENGEMDEGERPLANILFQLEYEYQSGYTNIVGKVTLQNRYGPCDPIRMFAKPPPGYRLTTASSAIITGEKNILTEYYPFGFAFDPGALIPTPYPLFPIQCQRYLKDFVPIEIAIDGRDHVWVLGVERTFELVRESGEWIEHAFGGLHLAAGSESVVITGYGEVSELIHIFTLGEWRTIPFPEGGISHVAASPDGSFWILGSTLLAKYTKEGARIESLPFDGAFSASSLAISNNQVLWIRVTTGA